MNPEQRARITKTYGLLVDNLEAEPIADNLFTQSIIEFDDKQRIEAEVTDRDKNKRLLDILITKENSYKPLLKEIQSQRPDLFQNLTQIDVDDELKKGIKE